MKKLSSLLLFFFLAIGTTHAHRDRLLTLQPDGSIPEIPAYLGPVLLKVEALGTDKLQVQLQIGSHKTLLPPCLSRRIKSTSPQHIRLSGSWYHDESLIPYYMRVEFLDTEYDPSRAYRSNTQFLFDLRNARLIQASRFDANTSDAGGQLTALDVSRNCSSLPTQRSTHRP